MARNKTSESGGESGGGGGFGGVLRGLGDLVDLVSNLAERAEKAGGELSRSGELGDDKKGVKAVYGFSVRVGGGGKPVVERFGNVKNVTKSGADAGPVVEETREPLVDVFDEGHHIVLVAELPGVDEHDIHFDVDGDVLALSAVSDGHGYRKEVLLPAAVCADEAVSSYRNGVLELKLPKAERSEAERSETDPSAT